MLFVLAAFKDILDLQKIESGKLELEEEPFSLRACIESAFFLLDNKASAKGLQLTYRISPLVLVKTMVGDVGRLRQVVVNLLHNGIKFTERGRVRLEVDLAAPESEGSESTDSSPKTLLERRGDGYCRLKFCIVDTGIGIPPERLKKLFKPFSQGGRRTSVNFFGMFSSSSWLSFRS
jgi:signal transduction histidine kinase